jgi:hypothetical protein
MLFSCLGDGDCYDRTKAACCTHRQMVRSAVPNRADYHEHTCYSLIRASIAELVSQAIDFITSMREILLRWLAA